MLIGSYVSTLGDKRRVAVPKRFLTELGEHPILAKWYEDCLLLVSDDFWQKLLGRLTGEAKVLKLGVRDIERFILGSAFTVDADAQGRIILPDLLVNYAKLKKDLVFVGLTDRVEIWDKEVWDKKSFELAKSTKEYIEGIGK